MTKDKKLEVDNPSTVQSLPYEQARALALELVAEYEPEHLDERSHANMPEGMSGKDKISSRSVVDMCTAVIMAKGSLVRAAEALQISRFSLDYNKKRHPAIEEAYKHGKEIRLDLWEDELDYQILEKHEFVPLMFALKTQGKSRGYIENQVVYKHITMDVLQTYTDDQIKRLAAGEEPAVVLGEKEIKAPKVKEIVDAESVDVE